MAFRDELVRCAACGNQFVYTVREQRRRAARGLATDAPVFCEECRGADVRLANASVDDAEAADETQAGVVTHRPEPVGRRPDARPAGRDGPTGAVVTDRGRQPGPAGREAGRPTDPRRPSGRDAAGRGRAGRGEGRSRKHDPPRQTELRVRHLGTVKWFDEERGFGFIAQEDGEELFVHSSAVLVDGRPALVQGQEVEYEIARTARGPQAVDVVPIG